MNFCRHNNNQSNIEFFSKENYILKCLIDATIQLYVSLTNYKKLTSDLQGVKVQILMQIKKTT